MNTPANPLCSSLRSSQEPGSRGRDGIPVFERGNVFSVTSDSDPKEVASLLVSSNDGYETSPSSLSSSSKPASDPPPPSPPFHPDQTLRHLVSAAVSISKFHAGQANASRKALLASTPPLTTEVDTVQAFCATLPSIDTPTLLRAYETVKWSSISSTTSSLAKKNAPFTDSEIRGVLTSLSLAGGQGYDIGELCKVMKEAGHLSHKDWARTVRYGDQFSSVVGTPDDAEFRSVFERVLRDGGYDSAVSKKPDSSKPWIVLVTGLNGIRKSTSVYQSWWKDCLAQALGDQYDGNVENLPEGGNSFFRQLDYMICTLASKEFAEMYEIQDVGTYSDRKASLFSRYRMLSEMLGAALLGHGKDQGINMMLETSGRDVAMYEYVDFLFPGDEYNKLCVNFRINDISYAERSVDERMGKEMEAGRKVFTGSNEFDAKAITNVNLGGPYGSTVLKGVKKDSERVWEEVRRRGA